MLISGYIQRPAARLSGIPGAPAKLLDAWERKLFTLVACDAPIADSATSLGGGFSGRSLAPAQLDCSDVMFSYLVLH